MTWRFLQISFYKACSLQCSLPDERVKVQKMDDDHIPVPKTKASKTDGNVCGALDSENEYIAGQGENDGSPSVRAGVEREGSVGRS